LLNHCAFCLKTVMTRKIYPFFHFSIFGEYRIDFETMILTHL